jgi:hypothetical protein
MKYEEIIKEAKKYFGKNRNLLKKKVLSFKFDGSNSKKLYKDIKTLTSQPFDLSYMMFSDVIDCITENKISEIDWHWLGDLSWKLDILLNENIEKGYDWYKKLTLKCNGTARILRIYISDILPCFVLDTHYMTFNKKENYFEFGPISKFSDNEKVLINKIKSFLKNQGLIYIDKKKALTKHIELYSDCNSDGNATFFDAVFCDTSTFQEDILRFNDKELLDPTGKKISWREYYDRNGKLKTTEEYRYFDSKNGIKIITDNLGQIIEATIWRSFGKKTHQEFKINLIDEFKKRKAERIIKK